MKILLSFLLLFATLASSAQADTSQQKSGKLALRMNDWETVTSYTGYSPLFEGLFDSVKIKVRTLYPTKDSYPSGSTMLTVDSVINAELVLLADVLRRGRNSANATTVDRVISAIKGLNSEFHYVNREIEKGFDVEREEFLLRRTEGKRRLRRMQ